MAQPQNIASSACCFMHRRGEQNVHISLNHASKHWFLFFCADLIAAAICKSIRGWRERGEGEGYDCPYVTAILKARKLLLFSMKKGRRNLFGEKRKAECTHPQAVISNSWNGYRVIQSTERGKNNHCSQPLAEMYFQSTAFLFQSFPK